MKRLAFASSVLLAAASPLPLVAQEAAPQEQVEAIDTGTGAQMAPIPGWMRDARDGILVFTAPEGDATAAVLGVDEAENGEAAVAVAWSRLDPGFDREVLIAQEPPARDGWDQITG